MSEIYRTLFRAEEAGLVVRDLERLSNPNITPEAQYLQHLQSLFAGTRVETLAREAENLLPTCEYFSPVEPAVRRIRQNAITYGYINEKLALTPLARARIGRWYPFREGIPNYQTFALRTLDYIVREEKLDRAQLSKMPNEQQPVQMNLF